MISRRRSTLASAMRPAVVVGCVVMIGVSCSGSDDSTDTETPSVAAETPTAAGAEAPEFVDQVVPAMEAVIAERGGEVEFFEVTANRQFVNLFVAVDDATAAVPYAFIDGELEPPAPTQTGAEGLTFTIDDVDFAPDAVTSGVQDELPDASVDAISVYGDGVAATYVLGVTSASGGLLDVVVTDSGQIVSVDPL